MDGGIFGLLGLIRDHRGAVEYDLRHRFGLGLRDIGDRLTIGEAARLIAICRTDPSSAVTAALEGWDFPISRVALALYDLYDLLLAAISDRKARPQPRPGRPYSTTTRDTERWGKARPAGEVAEILNRFGHTLPV
ncbi:MAG: hypothetical protein HOQ21_06015 [Dermatophilaceae bacterium]|nr:hypothetical protein [Dermatophilaceae bacterium]